MAYETKSIYVLIYELVKTSKTLDEALERIAKAANVEGVIINDSKKSSKKSGEKKD